ncbi:YopX family protein [Streptococcus dysgalactiae]|uniref:YopX family protein n=1 Tax=Streptococcus dysgalactiae TaxID=1334 RepID=UPI001FA95D1F|nr:YopX family protein [Streptococcus dysgalactiae]
MIPNFRAYFEQYKRMIYSIGIVNQNMILVDFHDTGDTESLFITDRIHVMQSTGLFDKNGVEIFDGDIVKLRYTITSDFELLKVTKSRGGSWRIGNRLRSSELWLRNEDCEVLGNIYENPELLESVEE